MRKHLILAIVLTLSSCGDNGVTARQACGDFCTAMADACGSDSTFIEGCTQCLLDANVPANSCESSTPTEDNLSNDAECVALFDDVLSNGTFNQAFPPTSCTNLLTAN